MIETATKSTGHEFYNSMVRCLRDHAIPFSTVHPDEAEPSDPRRPLHVIVLRNDRDKIRKIVAAMAGVGFHPVNRRIDSSGNERFTFGRANGPSLEFLHVVFEYDAPSRSREVGLSDPSAFRDGEGMVLAILGPDGVGKTTTTDRLIEMLRPAFTGFHLFHWRPQMIKPRDKDDPDTATQNWFAINRHGDPPRGALLSVARLMGVYADYIYGYFKLLRRSLKNSGLIVFDRYYQDILADSKRYRYGGPQWLLPALQHALPHKDVFYLILDAEEEVIFQRKREVTPEELRVQRRRYRELSRELKSAVLVRTDISFEHTLTEACSGILRYLAARFARHSGFTVDQQTRTARDIETAAFPKTA